MKKHGRGKRRRGSGFVTRRIPPGETASPEVHEDPIVLSITPQGVTLRGGASVTPVEGAGAEAARIRSQLEQHARDVEEFVRAQRFNSIVNRVLADIERPEGGGPRLRLRQ